MSLVSVLQDFATRAGTEDKSIRTLLNGNAANNAALTTTAKGNLVLAINEVNAAVSAASGIDDDVTSTSSTWSSQKIDDEIGAALAGVIDSAPGTLDTLNELAAALGDDANFAATVSTALGQRVAVTSQTFTGGEKTQARTNIGAQEAATIGDTTTNFVTVFEAALV